MPGTGGNNAARALFLVVLVFGRCMIAAQSDGTDDLASGVDDGACQDTDDGALDPYNDSCADYYANQGWCGGCECAARTR